MATAYKALKEGFVQAYRIEASQTPAADTYYFEVTISADEAGLARLQKWGLPRNNLSDVIDLTATGKRYGISYSNTHQAIIATVKDALHNGNKVLFEGNALDTDFVKVDDALIGSGDNVSEVSENIPGGDPSIIDPVADPGAVVVQPKPIPDDLPGFELRQVTIFK